MKVRIVITGADGVATTDIWTVRDLPPGGSAERDFDVPFHVPTNAGPEFAAVSIYAEIIETVPVETRGYEFNNAEKAWIMALRRTGLSQYTNGDTAVGVGVSDRFPQAGGATTFTAYAVNFPGPKHPDSLSSDNTHTQIDVQVKISLSPGLAFVGTQPQEPSGTTFDTSTGIWDVGTLGARNAQGRIVLELPVAVTLSSDSLADRPLKERCLTAEVVSAVPWPSKRENDIATVCLGDPKVPLRSGEIGLFHVLDCVGATSPPCTSTDTLELVVEADRNKIALPGLDRVDQFDLGAIGGDRIITWLQPETVIVQVPEHLARQSDETWHTGEPGVVHTLDVQDLSIPGTWTHTKRRISVPDGGTLPGSFSIRPAAAPTFNFMDPVNAKEAGPFPLTSAFTVEQFVKFGALGTYMVTPAFDFTHKTIDADMDNNKDVFAASGTYTFHVGPVSDLEIRDGGASRAVAAGQTAYTVMAVNNGPDAAPAVRVTGLPTGVTEFFASEGDYDSARGVWTIGELDTGVRRRIAGMTAFPTLTLVADTSTSITAAIENTQDYCVRIKDDAFDNFFEDLACVAGNPPTGYTEHTAAYFDYDDDNNTATIETRAGTGAGASGAPRSLRVQRYGTIAILRWMKVDRVNGFRVTHYHVERDDVIVANDVKEDILGNVYVDLGVDINQPHVSYRVRAVNEFGVPGPWSLPSGGVLTDAPGAPTGLTATASDEVGRIDLSWFAPSAESGLSYRIEHSSDGHSYDVLVQSQSGPTYTHSGLRPATIQYYRVATLKGGVTSRYVYADATTKIEPGAPRGLTATASDVVGRIVLSWMAPLGAEADSSLSYRIEHSSDGQSYRVLDTSYDGLTYTDNGLTPATLQYYRVAAVKDNVRSGWVYAQATTKITPGAPSGLTATASVVVGRINLSWFAPSADAGLHYRIEHSSDGESWRFLHEVYSPLTYTHNGLPPATRQYYRVATVKDGVTSAWAEAEATTKSDPGTPTGLTATRGYGVGRIDLSWYPPSTGSSPRYRIEHATNSAGPWRVLSSSYNGLTYSHHGLSPGTTHFYRVAAIQDGVTSGWVYAHDTTEAQPVLDERGRTVNVEHRAPLWPENLRFSSVDRTSVTLAWDPPANDGGTPVTGYEYRVYGPCASGADGVCDVVGPTRVSGTSRRITGLNVEGEYEFQVRALNAAGAGDWSLPVQKTVGAATAGGEATFRLKLSRQPTQPVWVIMHWDGDRDLEGELPVQQFKALLPSGYDTSGLGHCPPYHGDYDWDSMAYAWNVGVPITVTAAEDEDSENGRLTIRHSIYTVPAECLGNPPGWDYDPVYDDMFGIALEVTERDND